MASVAVVQGIVFSYVSVRSSVGETTSEKQPGNRAAVPEPAERPAAQYLTASGNMDFEQAQALTSFLDKLTRLSSGHAQTQVHILHFGDSHTAADQWTSRLRELFQRKFGNGGSGFSLAGNPFVANLHVRTQHGATPGWHTEGLQKGEGDGYFGLGGVSIYTRHAGESAYIYADCSRVGIYYLQIPGGGNLRLFDNDRHLREFSTAGEIEPKFVSYNVGPGHHEFKLLTVNDKPVRLLGWSTDNDSGVTYESLGINGAEASIFFRWKRAMFANYLQERNPALIVLAYGTNEAGDQNWTGDSYHGMFSALLKRLRDDCPTASILVVGPTDRLTQTRMGPAESDGVDRIIEAQRLACHENGCAFWSAKRRMGGRGSMRAWTSAGLGQQDFVHFTPAGYDRLAEMLFADLMRLFDAHRKARSVTTNLPNPRGK